METTIQVEMGPWKTNKGTYLRNPKAYPGATVVRNIHPSRLTTRWQYHDALDPMILTGVQVTACKAGLQEAQPPVFYKP